MLKFINLNELPQNMNRIEEIYNILLEKFGPQGWWPLTIKGFESKHHVGRPKNSKHRFEIIVGAIFTQYVVSC